MSTVEVQQEELKPQVPLQNGSTSLVNGHSEEHDASSTQEESVAPSKIPSEDPSLPAAQSVKSLLKDEMVPEPSQEANLPPSTLEDLVKLPSSNPPTEQDSQLEVNLPGAVSSQSEQETSPLEQSVVPEQDSAPAVIPEQELAAPAPKLEQVPAPEQESLPSVPQPEQESASSPSPQLEQDSTPSTLPLSEQKPVLLKPEQETSAPSPALEPSSPAPQLEHQAAILPDEASPVLQPPQQGEGDTAMTAATEEAISPEKEVKEGLPESALEATPTIQKPTEIKEESKREQSSPLPTATEGNDEDYSGMPPLEDIVKSTTASSKESPKPFKMEDTPRMTDEDGWIDLTGNGGLKKKVIQTGLGQETRPHHGDLVALTYQYYNMEGKLLEEEEHIEVILGDWDILPGVDMALALMEDKEKAELIIPERFAYMKDDGAGPDSVALDGPHLKMILEVESIEKQSEENFVSLERRKKFLEKKKTRAGMWFSKQYFNLALACYDKILGYIEKISALSPKEPREELEIQFTKDLETCHIIILNNKAACQLKLQMWNPCLQSLEEVLDKDPNNVKAIYRKAKALEELGKEDEAIALLKTTKESNKACRDALMALLIKKKKNEISEKKMCQRMFNTTEKEKKTSPPPKHNTPEPAPQESSKKVCPTKVTPSSTTSTKVEKTSESKQSLTLIQPPGSSKIPLVEIGPLVEKYLAHKQSKQRQSVVRWSSAIVGGIAAVAISFILYRQLNGASTH